MTAGARGRDRGAATVWAAFAACALCVVFGAVLALGQAVAARHRAGGAADLAALAAADRALWGEAEACAAGPPGVGPQEAPPGGCVLGGEPPNGNAPVVLGPPPPAGQSRS
ncbi:Rv3654c family TadE-like protein, partial [Streptomyces sp. NPDC056202]|uniref:Rv3654c family TadE-like protein n=1 Tax=Streptomyces sp. NPDC056202 TaxID=3345745 RepID=UPI0035D9B953